MQPQDIKHQLQSKIAQLSPQQLEKLLAVVEEIIEDTPRKKMFGSMPGLVKYMADDFDAPLDDFKDYMPE